jgi:hypothetical protein
LNIFGNKSDLLFHVESSGAQKDQVLGMDSPKVLTINATTGLFLNC